MAYRGPSLNDTKMDPVAKALWFVESHSRELVSLEDIANACHVSPFHITRAFAASTGLSLMRYVRARRLSEAARKLAKGAQDILQVALDAGYGSHEAFTRAFRDHFALTPEQVRAQGHLENLTLKSAVTMNPAPRTDIPQPRFETSAPTLLAGLLQRYHCESPAGIPDQWQRFTPYLSTLRSKKPGVAYGACYNFDQEGHFDYLTSVEVESKVGLPPELSTLPVPAQQYAIFHHPGHVASIRATFSAIWEGWFPNSKFQPDEGITLERYGPEFNAMTGLGGVELWIPVKPA